MEKRHPCSPSTPPTPAQSRDRFTAAEMTAVQQLLRLKGSAGSSGRHLAAKVDVNVIRQPIPPSPEDVLQDEKAKGGEEDTSEPLSRAKERFRLITDIYENGPVAIGCVSSAAQRKENMLRKRTERE